MWLTVLLLTAAIASQEAAQYPFNSQQPINLTPTVLKPNFTKRWNNFDFELLHKVGNYVSGNFMISPASIKAVLVMLLEGANGNCAQELRNTLRLPSDYNEIRQELGNYLSRLQTNTPGVLIEAANKVFISDQYRTNSAYENVLKHFYNSETQSLSFSQPIRAAQTINNWVDSKTHGQIKKLIDAGSLDAETVIVLVNALYFKGKWENAFDKKFTSPTCFYNNNECIMTQMMELQTEMKYTTNEEINAQIVDLPYQDGKYSMMIVLPMEANGLASLQKDFVQSTMSLILSQLQTIEVDLKMPKFSIDYSTDMTSILKEMGIHDLFSQNADLSQMISSTGRPQVNSVIHKTRIQVDENGSIASAATGAMVVPLMGSSGVRMIINHPFMFIIREIESGAILFAGRVEQPDSPTTYQENNNYQYQHRDKVVNTNNQRQPSGSRPNKPQRTETNQPSKNNYGEAQINAYNTPQPTTNQFLQSSSNTLIGRPALPHYSQLEQFSALSQNSQLSYQQKPSPQNINQNIQNTNQKTQYTNQNAQYTNPNAQYTNQNTQFTNQNVQYTNQNTQNTNLNAQYANQNTPNINTQYNGKPNYLQSNNSPYNSPTDARSPINNQDKINFPNP